MGPGSPEAATLDLTGGGLRNGVSSSNGGDVVRFHVALFLGSVSGLWALDRV